MGFIRIVGGEKKRRRIRVPGGQKVRPMSEKAREAVFSILGPDLEGMPVWDLFAGSGALGLEALSRGARTAIFVEKDPQVARVLVQNVNELGYGDRARVIRADVFRWLQREDIWPGEPVLVFVAPPYELYRSQMPRVTQMWSRLAEKLPPDSILVLQLDRSVDVRCLPRSIEWDVRTYGQVRNAIGRVPPRDTQYTGGGKEEARTDEAGACQ